MLTFNGVKSESEWTREFCAALTLCNAQVFACAASQMQTPGWPDRFISHPLFCAWVEMKRDSNSLSKLQEKIIQDLNCHRAGSAFVLWLSETYDKLYPCNISWYSKQHGKWMFSDCTNMDTPLRLLQSLGSFQLHERIIDRKAGNVYA